MLEASEERKVARALFYSATHSDSRMPIMRKREMMGDAIAARRYARRLDFEAHQLIWGMR